MKIIQFVLKSSKNVKRVGLQLRNDILDLTEGLEVKSAMEFIQGGTEMMKKAERYGWRNLDSIICLKNEYLCNCYSTEVSEYRQDFDLLYM